MTIPIIIIKKSFKIQLHVWVSASVKTIKLSTRKPTVTDTTEGKLKKPNTDTDSEVIHSIGWEHNYINSFKMGNQIWSNSYSNANSNRIQMGYRLKLTFNADFMEMWFIY